MEHLRTLLERRNLCLRNLLKISEAFAHETIKDDLDNLEKFQLHRKNLIRVIQALDSEINVASALISNIDDLVREEIKCFLRQKDSLLHSIIDIDGKILNDINKIKMETLQKLQALQSQRKTLSAYKSPQAQIETAEGNTSLNHKA